MTETFQHLFDRMNHLSILVIGDVMADAYIRGKVDRISPEAPVPVLHTRSHEVRLGGAANVAQNLRSLGAHVSLVARVGEDEMGNQILDLMRKDGIQTSGMVVSNSRPTTVKTRIIAGGQHLLRLDEENDSPTFESEKADILTMALAEIKGKDAVIFEDYDKGLIFPELIAAVVREANVCGIPVLVDPKKRNFSDYKGVSLFKPNLKELKEGLKTDVDPSRLDEVEKACQKLATHLGAKGILLTLSEFGMAIWTEGNFYHIPAMARDIADVSGAGDTVIAVATACLAAGCPPKTILSLSNLAGGLVCESSGVVPIDKIRLLKEAQEMEID